MLLTCGAASCCVMREYVVAVPPEGPMATTPWLTHSIIFLATTSLDTPVTRPRSCSDQSGGPDTWQQEGRKTGVSGNREAGRKEDGCVTHALLVVLSS